MADPASPAPICPGDLAGSHLGLARERCLAGPTVLDSSLKVAQLGARNWGCRPHEVFIALHLDDHNRLLSAHEMGRGMLDQVVVDPRVLFAGLLIAGGSGLIISHNHPSGDPGPSQDDAMLTRTIEDGAEVLGIAFIDHLIVTGRPGPGGYYSFADNGRLARGGGYRRGQRGPRWR